MKRVKVYSLFIYFCLAPVEMFKSGKEHFSRPHVFHYSVLCTVSIHKAALESNLASQWKLNDHKCQETMCNCPIQAIVLQATLWIKHRDYGFSLWQLLKHFHKDSSLRDALPLNNFLKTQGRYCSNKVFFCFCKFKMLLRLSIFRVAMSTSSLTRTWVKQL